MKQSGTKSHYLDHAAATPMDPAVYDAMRPYLETSFANPSSLYQDARDARNAVESARHKIAGVLGAKPTEIVFTSGGTEGDNMAIQGVLRSNPGARWVTTAIEHDAVLGCVEPMEREGHGSTIVPVKSDGIVDAALIDQAINDTTVLVSVMMANNEVGTVQPIADIAKLVARIRADRAIRGVSLPIYLHTDAVQAAGYLDIHVARLGIDLLTISGSKIYGPKGTGALYVRHGVNLQPLQFGGGQERGRRSGTENVAGAVGLGAAMEIAAQLRETESHRIMLLRNELADRIEAVIPEATINGSWKRRMPNNLNLTIPGADGESMVLYMDNAGIQVSTGSACSTGNLDPSHVLLAIGRSTTQASSSLRLTLGRSTDSATIDRVIEALPPIVARLKQLAETQRSQH